MATRANAWAHRHADRNVVTFVLMSYAMWARKIYREWRGLGWK